MSSPMSAHLLNVIPLLPARDVEEAIAFYRDRIGFELVFRDAEPARYAGIRRDAVTLHLYFNEDRYLAENTGLRIAVDDVDGLYAQCQAAGCVHPNGTLEMKPWGSREFSVLDPSGVCIAFLQAG
jgi:uncharacterized glyoxalase superfamily protein PhnB